MPNEETKHEIELGIEILEICVELMKENEKYQKLEVGIRGDDPLVEELISEAQSTYYARLDEARINNEINRYISSGVRLRPEWN